MTNTPGEAQPPPHDPNQPPSESHEHPPQQHEYGYGPQQPVQGYPPPPQQPYGYGPPQPRYAPDHPQATTSLIVGIVGIVVCSGVISPIAWVIGKKAVNEIDASGGQWGGRGAAQAGYILGIIGTCILALIVLMFVAFIAIAIIGAASTASMY